MPHIPRLLISACRGGSGKTLLTLGLTRAFSQEGIICKPYKKGPDYIDAAWLALASKQDCTPLDPYFLNQARLSALLQHSFAHSNAELAVIEGNRGLFDGTDIAGSSSSAELAFTLNCPIVLTLDCTKMTRTAAALVQGLTAFDPRIHIAGLVLNQLGTARQEQLLRQVLETYTDVPVVGALPRLRHNPMPERHMGLAAQHDTCLAEHILDDLAAHVREHVDVARCHDIARAAPPLEQAAPFWETPSPSSPSAVTPRIGYVRDRILWFYYPENLEALERAGAELVPLSLESSQHWEELDGLYLGGGFPEDHAASLTQSPHLARIADWAHKDMPIYAECGGFMLLARTLRRDANTFPMAAIFPVHTEFFNKPQGLGYVCGTIDAHTPFFPIGTHIRGHEFHYSRCIMDTAEHNLCTLHLEKGTGMGNSKDGLLYKNTFAAYTHIFAPTIPAWAPAFVRLASEYAMKRNTASLLDMSAPYANE